MILFIDINDNDRSWFNDGPLMIIKEMLNHRGSIHGVKLMSRPAASLLSLWSGTLSFTHDQWQLQTERSQIPILNRYNCETLNVKRRVISLFPHFITFVIGQS